MATKKTTQKKKTVPILKTARRQLSDFMNTPPPEGDLEQAQEILDNMSSMLLVLSAIDPKGDACLGQDDLGKVFYVLHQWTEAARKEINEHLCGKEQAA